MFWFLCRCRNFRLVLEEQGSFGVDTIHGLTAVVLLGLGGHEHIYLFPLLQPDRSAAVDGIGHGPHLFRVSADADGDKGMAPPCAGAVDDGIGVALQKDATPGVLVNDFYQIGFLHFTCEPPSSDFCPKAEKDPDLPIFGWSRSFVLSWRYGGCGSWTAVRVGAKLPPALLLLPR